MLQQVETTTIAPARGVGGGVSPRAAGPSLCPRGCGQAAAGPRAAQAAAMGPPRSSVSVAVQRSAVLVWRVSRQRVRAKPPGATLSTPAAAGGAPGLPAPLPPPSALRRPAIGDVSTRRRRRRGLLLSRPSKAPDRSQPTGAVESMETTDGRGTASPHCRRRARGASPVTSPVTARRRSGAGEPHGRPWHAHSPVQVACAPQSGGPQAEPRRALGCGEALAHLWLHHAGR